MDADHNLRTVYYDLPAGIALFFPIHRFNTEHLIMQGWYVWIEMEIQLSEWPENGDYHEMFTNASPGNRSC